MPVVEILLSEEARTRAPDQQNTRGRMVVKQSECPSRNDLQIILCFFFLF